MLIGEDDKHMGIYQYMMDVVDVTYIWHGEVVSEEPRSIESFD